MCYKYLKQLSFNFCLLRQVNFKSIKHNLAIQTSICKIEFQFELMKLEPNLNVCQIKSHRLLIKENNFHNRYHNTNVFLLTHHQ